MLTCHLVAIPWILRGAPYDHQILSAHPYHDLHCRSSFPVFAGRLAYCGGSWAQGLRYGKQSHRQDKHLSTMKGANYTSDELQDNELILYGPRSPRLLRVVTARVLNDDTMSL